MWNLNLSGSLNIFRLLGRPSLCLPHVVVPTFNDLPIPLDQAFAQKGHVDIQAVVLDKDDCFASPESNEVHPAYKAHFDALRTAYPGRRLLIVSNMAGALSHDRDGRLAGQLERATGVTVLHHYTKKPGCAHEIMAYFAAHPDSGVVAPHQVAVIGDRLATDMMLANSMGSWAIWIREGVSPLENKSVFSKIERSMQVSLVRKGFTAPHPTTQPLE